MNSNTYKSNLYIFVLGAALLPFIAFGCTEPSAISRLQLEDGSGKNIVVKAAEILQDSLNDDDPRIRTNAIEVVATTRQMHLMPVVDQLLTDRFTPVRFAASLAVGDTKYSSSKKRLTSLLKAPDINTRLAAAYGLYKLGDKSKIQLMIQQINSPDMDVRANAALVLGKTGDKEAINPLRTAIEAKDSDDKVRFQSAQSLALLGDKAIYPKLWSMILNINADDRILGAQAMGDLGTEEAQGALTTLISDPNEVLEVRLAAAGQLGKLGSTIGEPHVIEAFSGKIPLATDPVRAERICILSAMAIGEIKTPQLTQYLPQLLNYRSKFVRLAAAKAVFMCDVID